MSRKRNPNADPVRPGDHVADRYEVVQLLGSGGIAHVYRARDQHTGQDVAIKIMTVEGDRDLVEHMAERFQREARIVRTLRHSGIVELLDFGFLREPRDPFLVMELLEGHDLDVQLKGKGPIAPSRAIDLMLGALRAVTVAHEVGVIHKDLKPANLFLADPYTDDERLVVLDFGGATAMWDERITQYGKFMGTPKYLAPEYIEHHTVSPALDVYQLGLVLSFMLSGVQPVPDSKPLDCARRHLSGDLVIPEALLEGDFGDVLRTAVSRDVNARFESAHAFWGALSNIDPSTVPDVRPRLLHRTATPPPEIPIEALGIDAAHTGLTEWSLGMDALKRDERRDPSDETALTDAADLRPPGDFAVPEITIPLPSRQAIDDDTTVDIGRPGAHGVSGPVEINLPVHLDNDDSSDEPPPPLESNPRGDGDIAAHHFDELARELPTIPGDEISEDQSPGEPSSAVSADYQPHVPTFQNKLPWPLVIGGVVLVAGALSLVLALYAVCTKDEDASAEEPADIEFEIEEVTPDDETE